MKTVSTRHELEVIREIMMIISMFMTYFIAEDIFKATEDGMRDSQLST